MSLKAHLRVAPRLAAVAALLACGQENEPPSGATQEAVAAPGGRADAMLRGAILAQLAADPGVDATSVVVVVDGEAVSLSGPSEVDWRRACAAAIAVAGEAEVSCPGNDVVDGELGMVSPVAGAGVGATEFNLAELYPLQAELGGPLPRGTANPADTGGSEADPATGSGAAPALAPTYETYVVLPGETLSRVAEKTLGSAREWRRIYELNERVIGPDPERVRDGMELRIPLD